MISKLLKLTAAFVLCANAFTAQVSNYTFTQSIGNYGSPSTGTVIGLPAILDDVNAVALPFTFVYNGSPYTSINVCTNGYMSFSSITGMEYQPVSDPTTQDLISAFGTQLLPASGIIGDFTAGSNTITNCSSVIGYSVGDVLFDTNNDFTGDPTITAIVGNNLVVSLSATNTVAGSDVVAYGTIIKSVSGIAPNRVCEFEYRHFSRLDMFFDPMYGEVINFKVKLYETTNQIEFVYDMISGTGITTPSEIGLKGSTNADFNTRTVVEPGAWSASNPSSVITDACDLSNTLGPISGQTYAWAPLNCVTPTLMVAQSPTFTCPGAAVTLSASGANSYTWTNGPSTAQYSVSPLVTTSYTLIGANAECTSTIVVTHSIIPSPSITITHSGNQECAGTTITLTASGATSYTWTNGPLTPQYTVNPNVTTVYTITGSNGGACNGITLATQSVIPYPVLNITPTNASICAGQTTTLTATGANGYSWSNGGTTAQISITPSVTTTYTLVGNNAQCTSTMAITQNVDVCLGLKESSLADNISIYPNPFKNELTIKNSSAGKMTITIADALGKTVYASTIPGDTSETLETSFLNNGLYFLNLSNEKSSITKKIVKN